MDIPDHDTRNIVLTGFMGTGKSTVGRLLAQKLGFDFVDTDDLIEQRHGPIAEIFADSGEAAFRAIERTIAEELSERHRLVVATGGRMMLDAANVACLSRNGRVFCLVATPEEILERVSSGVSRNERPLLAVPDPHRRIVELLAERSPEYRRFAQVTTGGRPPATIATDLVTLARADPHRIVIDTPAGDCEFWVGAALLPLVRQLAGVDGHLVVVAGADTPAAYLASLPWPDLVITLPSGSTPDSVPNGVAVVHDALLDAALDRSATLVSLGDRVVGDIAALAAATHSQGIDLVHCPTDLSAMVDTRASGPVDPNPEQGRDVDRAHHLTVPGRPPKAVIADVATLQALDPRVFAAGMAELLKLALIAGSDLLTHLEADDWRTEAFHALPGALGDLQSLVAEAVRAKIAILQHGPLEFDGREVLHLGHPFTDALEQVDSQLLHGEAVGLGLIAAARLSEVVGVAGAGLSERVGRLVEHLELPTTVPTRHQASEFLEAMRSDKVRRKGHSRFVLLADIGAPLVAEEVPENHLFKVLESMQA